MPTDIRRRHFDVALSSQRNWRAPFRDSRDAPHTHPLEFVVRP